MKHESPVDPFAQPRVDPDIDAAIHPVEPRVGNRHDSY